MSWWAYAAKEAFHTAGRHFQKSKSNILIFPFSACLVPIRSRDSQQQQPCERSCRQAEDAHAQLKQSNPPLSLCLSLSLSLSPPPAPSPPPIWGREDDYHQPAVLQCPDDHLPPAVHCRSVKFSVCLSVSLPVWSAQDIFFNNRSQQTIIQEFQAC